jgi:hypothetical protein
MRSQRRTINALYGVCFAAAFGLCSASFVFAEDSPGLEPAIQDTGARPEEAGAIQERAIRQGAGAGQGAQCVCERALGQCVMNAFGCVPHQGNPCNGGCVMKQSSSSIGGAARNPALAAPPSTMPPGAATR